VTDSDSLSLTVEPTSDLSGSTLGQNTSTHKQDIDVILFYVYTINIHILTA